MSTVFSGHQELEDAVIVDVCPPPLGGPLDADEGEIFSENWKWMPEEFLLTKEMGKIIQR